MKCLNLEIELEYDDALMYGDDREGARWFLNKVLNGGRLTLHDHGDLDDEVGAVRLRVVPTLRDIGV